jgi:hypothetical protein
MLSELGEVDSIRQLGQSPKNADYVTTRDLRYTAPLNGSNSEPNGERK